jgi:hypothetical protein
MKFCKIEQLILMWYFRVNVKIPFYIKFIKNNILGGFADGKEFSALSFA